MTKILDGKVLRDKILLELKEKTSQLNLKPGLAVVLIGNDPASQIYVKNKISTCKKIGFYSKKILISKNTSRDEIFSHLDQLNHDKKIHGILVQYP
ncbi:MAG: tetrahydrofolate dehydrogenase/cyclohydrolase catalytic domain-containing protein, partial [Microgenomates group bacterium]